MQNDPCPERERLVRGLAAIAGEHDAWQDALVEFAGAPSIQAWEGLMRFTPPERHYHRVRNALRVLADMGVDADLLFTCATETHFGVVRLLREAFAVADREFPPILDAFAVRDAADDDLNAMLDRAGIPRHP